MIELHLPILPISKNRLRKRTRTGIARSKAYERWRMSCGLMLNAQLRGRKLSGAYRITIQAKRPEDNRRRDLGNFLEATEDLLTTVGAIEDDSWSEHINMRWVSEGEGTYIRIEKAGVE